ncbi:hypothetical protein HY502_04025 [Candidatus Woesebacteria bacterium]|nr:hypothetical protein [Candidatus Woesebacteria bacterium]
MASPDLKRSEEQGPRVVPNIQDEFSPLRKVLVVPTPEVFTRFNDLIVNPVQAKRVAEAKEKGPVEDVEVIPLAAPQHRKLLETLKNEGVELVYSYAKPGRKGHTPSFTRDVGVVIGNRALSSKMRHEYRQGEVSAFVEVFDKDTLLNPNVPYKLEGGDLALIEPNLALVCIGPRTNEVGLEVLRASFPDWEFIPVYQEGEKAFHLDTMMGILGNKCMVYLVEIVPPETLSLLKKRGFSLVAADFSEFDTCCTNVLAISDRKIIAAAENKITNERIRNSGIEVIEVELSSHLPSGGGPHCLTLPLIRS